MRVEGIIVESISNQYKVKAHHEYYVCTPRGKFKQNKTNLLVGDKVLFDDSKKVITDVIKRKNELIRPPVANIDQALIVMSVKHPDLDTDLLDKLLAIIGYNSIDIVICFTKLDLLTLTEIIDINLIIDYYRDIGYNVLTNNDCDKLKSIFKDKVTVFTGQSGVGKSSLLNKLNPSFNLKTNDISYSLGRGKHTTRHVSLMNLYDGQVLDTPGFSSLDFIDMTKEDIRDNFMEIFKYGHECLYRDCMHLKEPDCKIKMLVEEGIILKSRYEHYLKFMQSKETKL